MNLIYFAITVGSITNIVSMFTAPKYILNCNGIIVYVMDIIIVGFVILYLC